MAEGQSRREQVVLSSCLGVYVWACFGLLLVLPINIIAIVAGAIWIDTCESGVLLMTVGEWLIVAGCVDLTFFICTCPMYIATPCTIVFGYGVMTLSHLWHLVWAVLGGVVIFTQEGVDCHEEAVWILAATYWVVMLIGVVVSLCSCVITGHNGYKVLTDKGADD
mmetsp:Transcript_12221/g.49078  ORF Transcript_12221/g.49078 Transcript_12221/m.49078 type:complete len:165 (+) Transcript_12221:96-590(+)|eukprot:CAMPEP_0114624554 /NCGR_PEP_ID=MMETSP0168-20121206/10824_1 /TAXON_ID=95228 ORGANISM="Vannella sp., Strain DIVA3 517/6/12" /NCGR_SAMPLE_ID=MMETSP0168 /ASSEMBLY_ACC=CAM_ASM_000044 /LENGTH=164 /DNA_ID=CAMNT_0001835827 /DNA_START=42 /DNA_END=536 /DNA_ORIENTATION=-